MKKISSSLLICAIALSTLFIGCKPKDSDIQANIQKAISDPKMGNLKVDVKDGVATLTGDCVDQMCKDKCTQLAKEIKGVKEVVNNAMLPAPPPPPVAVIDASTQQKVKDAIKDIKGITASFNNGKISLSGNLSTMERMKLMQAMASAHLVPDVTGLITK